MSEAITIQSASGPYKVHFFSKPEDCFALFPANSLFIADKNIYKLYPGCLDGRNFVLIDANENSKSLGALTPLIETLLQKGLRRGDRLVAVGGGITQDITAFLATTLFRGLKWSFVPTTLLAQADSCIGSKSSINVGAFKNLMGTFHPPVEVCIATGFLKTLKPDDLRSGIGEMIKVHMIESPDSVFALDKDYSALLEDSELLKSYIEKSLLIKKKIIEVDEFDQNIRNILNYGHSFGHAIESATDFAVPHGIAVTMGMDMANFTSVKLGHWAADNFQKFHPLLKKNSHDYMKFPVPVEKFIAAIAADKKNSQQSLNLILPQKNGKLVKTPVPNDARFREICVEYFNVARGEFP